MAGGRREDKTPKKTSRPSAHDEERTASRDFAFPKQRKEPIYDAEHVRNAIARFDQVEDVSDADRDEAWKRITTEARKYGIEVEARDWRELMKGGKAGRRA